MIRIVLTAELRRRFWAKVDRRGPDECWPWLGGLNDSGYGRLDGLRTHRISWTIANGPIPRGKEILHSCDNPPCVNPRHLKPGTQADNMRDMTAKGRHGTVGTRFRGEGSALAKLTWAEVREIRRLHEAEGLGAWRLAKRFGVGKSNIQWILAGKTWKEAA